MAVDTFADVTPTGETPDEIVRAYRNALADILDRVDDERLGDAIDPDGSSLGEDLDELELGEVATILAVDECTRPDAMREELLDQLLIEMTAAVVDVDALAGEVALDYSGKELQQRIEGRAPMTLREYALIRHAIESGQ